MNEKQLIIAILQVLGQYRDRIRAADERVEALEGRGAEITVTAPNVSVEAPSVQVEAPDLASIADALGGMEPVDLSGVVEAIQGFEVPGLDISPLVDAISANTDAVGRLVEATARREAVTVEVSAEAQASADAATQTTQASLAALTEFAGQQVVAMQALLGKVEDLEAATSDLAAAAFAPRMLEFDDDGNPIGVRVDRPMMN